MPWWRTALSECLFSVDILTALLRCCYLCYHRPESVPRSALPDRPQTENPPPHSGILLSAGEQRLFCLVLDGLRGSAPSPPLPDLLQKCCPAESKINSKGLK